MQPSTRAGLRGVEREILEKFMANFSPPGGRRVFIRKTLLSHVKYATAARFSQQNLANWRSETLQKPMLGVKCASKTADFTLCPLAWTGRLNAPGHDREGITRF